MYSIFAAVMEQQEKFIIEGSTELFIKYGIRSITMDDVARELAVSKKTLYKYVSNKADLVDRCVKHTYESVREVIEEAIGLSQNAIDELFAIDSSLSEAMKAQHPALEFQLKKYYPATWKWLSNRQEQMIMDQTRKNLEKGIEQGVYRKDFDIEMIAYLYFAQFVAMHNEDIVPMQLCENPKFMKTHFEYHLRGIVSKKGLSYLEDKLQEISQN